MNDDQLTLYRANWCPDCRNTKQALGETGVGPLTAVLSEEIESMLDDLK